MTTVDGFFAPDSYEFDVDHHGDAVMAARSAYPGGVNVAMADGRVIFISDYVDTGDMGVTRAPSGPSPFGVWGALGTRNNGDLPGGFE